jgi:hypothetical protein
VVRALVDLDASGPVNRTIRFRLNDERRVVEARVVTEDIVVRAEA